MISLGPKFVDYGLTGGFAICAQATLLFWLAPDTADSLIACALQVLSTHLGELPPGLVTPISAVITAVAIISIFFLGLVLELMGSLFAVWEANIFKKHLEQHRSWLSDLLANYGLATVQDLDRIVSEFGNPMGTKEWRNSLRIFAFWKHSNRQNFIEDQRRVFRRFRLLKPFSRIQALLLSYVLAADSAPRLDLLRDHLQLCRVSRAVSVVLYLLSFEIVFLPLNNLGRTFTPIDFIWFLPGFVMCALGMFLPIKAYALFCDSLFAHVLVLSHKLDKEGRGQTSVESGALRQDSDNG